VNGFDRVLCPCPDAEDREADRHVGHESGRGPEITISTAAS
jgi:hypothetical protein